MAAETSVTIIGLGSRGLGVLERVLSLAARPGQPARLRVEVIDPAADGAGIHSRDQPDYLLLNTICSQVSMFPDQATVADGTHRAGPSLYQWALDRDLRVAADGFSLGSAGRPVRPTDFLPRRVLGDYLAWFFELLLSQLPERVALTVHRAEAIELTDHSADQLRIALSDGTVLLSDFAFLTTGYTSNRRPAGTGRRLITEPYPMPDQLAGIGADQTVALAGFGLSAMDAMSCLTVGRGGRFVGGGDQLRYLPSGDEPRLAFYSRTGIPCRARPRLLEYGPPYRPLVFTPAGLDARRGPGGMLELDTVVWPMIELELRIAYRRCVAAQGGPAAVRELEGRLAAADAAGSLAELLAELDVESGPMTVPQLLDGPTPMRLQDSAGYQGWVAGTIQADLAEGALGLSGSLVKGSLDILRQLRDTFRHAVDFGGLSERSLEAFMATTVPILNRAVVGPQYERHAEFVALMSAGIVSAPFGPAPSVDWQHSTQRWLLSSRHLQAPYRDTVDWLVAGWLELPSVSQSSSPLLDGLYRAGRIRPHRPGSTRVVGIDVDRNQHPIDAQGRPDLRVWVLGPLCEGATFYNNLVPSPSSFSRPVHDAHRCVAELFAADRALAGSR